MQIVKFVKIIEIFTEFGNLNMVNSAQWKI